MVLVVAVVVVAFLADGVYGLVTSFLSYLPRFLPVCTLIIFGPVMLGVLAEEEAVVFAGELTLPFSSSLSTLHFNYLTVKGLSRLLIPGLLN